MTPTRYAQAYRFFLTILLSIFPLTGCAALSAIQQIEQQDQGGTWALAPANASSEESQSARGSQSRSQERNPLVRTVADAPSVRAEAPVLAGSAALASTLREEGDGWIGTRYRYGGTTRRGIDCSSFVQQLMHGALDIELPRTTATQQHRGVAVSRDELLPADLVFFRRRGTRHVGVYLGDGDFIHASSSRGVTISNLSENYYRRHYWKARRVVDNPQAFLADEDLVRPQEPADMLRPGSRRSTDRAPERSQSRRSGNPRTSW